MTTFILITPNHLVNLDQVIEVEYAPPSSGIDDETDKPFECKSALVMTTNALEVEVESGYEGDFAGCASRSQTIRLRGDEADRVWKILTNPKTKITRLR